MAAPRRNLEIKLRVADLEPVERAALALGAEDRGASRDRDTYFMTARGRLKLRQTAGQAYATLIAYARDDLPRSRPSDYWLTRIERPEELRAGLAATLGVLVAVEKTRHLFVWGATRIHLDRVAGLGDFVELETVMAGQPETDAQVEHAWLQRSLGLDRAEVEPLSYSDLLVQQKAAS